MLLYALQYEIWALLSAYQHVKRTEDAVRKVRRLYCIPEAHLEGISTILNYSTKNHGHPLLFSNGDPVVKMGFDLDRVKLGNK